MHYQYDLWKIRHFEVNNYINIFLIPLCSVHVCINHLLPAFNNVSFYFLRGFYFHEFCESLLGHESGLSDAYTYAQTSIVLNYMH